MVAAEHISCFTSCKTDDAGYVVFYVKSHLTKAGLEYDTHPQHKYQQEVKSVGYLLESKYHYKICDIENNDSCPQNGNITGLIEFTVEPDIAEHGRMCDQYENT